MRIGYFVVELNDGTNKVVLSGNVLWAYGGDNVVLVKSFVDSSTGSVLDKWESNKTEIQVEISPKCFDYKGDMTECPEDIEDYNSQSGNAIIEWEYNPIGDSEIKLSFVEVS